MLERTDGSILKLFGLVYTIGEPITH
jgi:hypothetical protein